MSKRKSKSIFNGLEGQKFGKLTVIKNIGINKRYQPMYLCRCNCENILVIKSGSDLVYGIVKSCGCLNSENLEHKKFNKLTVIKEIRSDKGKGKIWLCKCDCGNTIEVPGKNLKDGTIKSCGCLKRTKTYRSYGKSNSLSRYNKRLNKIWCDMLGRCYEEDNISYKNYGGKGIKICDEWRFSYNNFYNWAIENGYKNNLSIDRINNIKNYEPSNCRWATRKEQNNNRTDTVYITINNETKTISEWSEITGIKRGTIKNRWVHGWCGEDIIRPVREKAEKQSGIKNITWDKTHNKWQVELKINKQRVYVGIYDTIKEAVKAKEDYLKNNT